MDSGSTKKIALISIHPEFVEKISNGTKRVEFRKRTSDVVSIYFVYSTAPIQKIVGFFEVKEIHRDTPKSIWNKFFNVAGIDSKRYFEYYSDYNEAVAIEIKKFYKFNTEFEIHDLIGLKSPPQSYAFVPMDDIPRIKKEIKKSNRQIREVVEAF
jgi:predicted transcriptional regulator